VVASIATERAAKKIVYSEKQKIISTSDKNLLHNEHILLPIANLMNIEKLLEFTLLIKDKKSVNPVTVLSVVPNNAEAEMNIVSARKKLEEYKKQGAASEIKINTIATIDLNATTGIERISKEIMADIIVLGWPNKAGILEKLIGEKIYSIINNVDKNLFICHQEKLLMTQKRIVVLAPPLAEKEIGFETWLFKILKLSQELSIPMLLFGNVATYNAVKSKIKHKHINSSISFTEFNDWEDFPVLAKNVNADDLLVLISARKNAVSYQKYLDHIPSKLEKHFHENNKIVVYPQQNNNLIEKRDNIATIPLNYEPDHIESVKRRIKRVFNKR
jgi:hypothetical protein